MAAETRRKLVLATHNANKVRKIGEILPDFAVTGEDSVAEETAETFAELAPGREECDLTPRPRPRAGAGVLAA